MASASSATVTKREHYATKLKRELDEALRESSHLRYTIQILEKKLESGGIEFEKGIIPTKAPGGDDPPDDDKPSDDDEGKPKEPSDYFTLTVEFDLEEKRRTENFIFNDYFGGLNHLSLLLQGRLHLNRTVKIDFFDKENGDLLEEDEDFLVEFPMELPSHHIFAVLDFSEDDGDDLVEVLVQMGTSRTEIFKMYGSDNGEDLKMILGGRLNLWFEDIKLLKGNSETLEYCDAMDRIPDPKVLYFSVFVVGGAPNPRVLKHHLKRRTPSRATRSAWMKPTRWNRPRALTRASFRHSSRSS